MFSTVITGNAGSGKSTLSSFFLQFDIDTICADKINRNILEYCRFISCQVHKIIGSIDINLSREIDKDQLRNIIFNDPLIKKSIESILHPLIYENMILQKSLHAEKPYIILEIPLLFESQSRFNDIDSIILITSEHAYLQRRIASRPGVSSDQAENMLNSQIADKNKFSVSDVIVINHGDLSLLQENALKIDHYMRSIFSFCGCSLDRNTGT